MHAVFLGEVKHIIQQIIVHNLATLLPITLYCVWEHNREIPDHDSPKPSLRTNTRAVFYKTKRLLQKCQRIWTTLSIMPDEARWAQELHVCTCWAWSLMYCHLTPNFCLFTHRNLFIYCLGPVYGFQLFGPEANNGRLIKVNTNRHTGGELESTMMWS
ncbi:hypothetical protein HETIRDRAFT_419089 [Heterobasidion irregulare TC 32-1]|uniref:Uncharacterized protein n=1 Tax=Heterobasidion irregulare (strain TC 32-1) TaxID=747525 RepID=W4K762_HETIT|nr:uncharacterized protein HETIRDRAFT_419089 [Heterobasidion irregulare TC 32-1]ETW81180.1 hypothetical protein HETIRDRAFT_419089 [Heterobasidion irregulare TC 32-1]